MSTFETVRKVEFQHCDPAGIVFYPRYFEMLTSVVEEWFDRALGVDYADMHLRRGEGVPTARIEVEFPAPSRLGEALAFTLALTHIGTASARTHIEARSAGEIRLVARSVLVHVAGADMRPAPWPELVRTEMQRYVETLDDGDANAARAPASAKLESR